MNHWLSDPHLGDQVVMNEAPWFGDLFLKFGIITWISQDKTQIEIDLVTVRVIPRGPKRQDLKPQWGRVTNYTRRGISDAYQFWKGGEYIRTYNVHIGQMSFLISKFDKESTYENYFKDF